MRKSRQSDVPRIKFRSSCDACTDAKVRCDKQHPQCGRCIRMATNCCYSVSMRSGKPAIDYVKSFNAAKSLIPSHRLDQSTALHNPGAYATADLFPQAMLPPGGQSQSSTRNSSKSPVAALGSSLALVEAYQGQEASLDLEPGLLDLSCPPPPTPSGHSDGMDGHSGQSISSSFCSPIDVSAMEDYFYTEVQGFPRVGDNSQLPGFSISDLTMDPEHLCQLDVSELRLPRGCNTCMTDSTDSGQGRGSIPIDPSLQNCQSPSKRHSCARKAKQLQQSVMMIASKAETVQREQGTTSRVAPKIATDQALLICSDVTQQLLEILRCRCETDAYLPFLISVIVSRILSVYSAIAKVDDAMPLRFGSKSDIPKKQDQPQDAFEAVALRLGAYDVDWELEGHLRRRLVVHELSKFESVVQLFAEKYCQDGEDGKRNEVWAVYSSLGEFIKNRCIRIKAACEKNPS